jgi:hypothetical protein
MLEIILTAPAPFAASWARLIASAMSLTLWASIWVPRAVKVALTPFTLRIASYAAATSLLMLGSPCLKMGMMLISA